MRATTGKPPWTQGRWRGRCRVLGVALLACAVLLAGAAWFSSSDLRCEAQPGISEHGRAEWSWFPVGTTCRWTEVSNGFDRVEDPGPAPTIVIAGLLVTGLGLVLTSLPRRSDVI